MRAVFFGTPDFAIASIRALLGCGWDVPLVCTRPARRVGRGLMATPTPVARFAEESGLPVITPERLGRDEIEAIDAAAADVFVVVAYGRFIPSELLAIPRFGVVNLHPSLLPRHRGPSPVATAILEGNQTTGVTTMLLDEGMDTGPILAQSDEVEITDQSRCDELTVRLFELGAEMLPGVLQRWTSGELTPQPQDDALATVTPLIKKEDGIIDWRRSASEIVRMTRAFHPWPGTSTSWGGGDLKIVDIELPKNDEDLSGFEAGEVFVSDAGGVFVRAGDGRSVRLVTIQAPGRRAMSVREFIVGRPDLVGAVLGR